MSALVLNGYNPAPHHRQNRRRERPGSRSRRSITRKSQIHDICLEGLYDARDASLYLPSAKASPSPLLRQSFDQSWERWKAREAEEKSLAELDKTQLELEQRRLFGGDVDDDELHSMGILYDDEDAAGTSVSEMQTAPAFVIRPGKPRHTRHSAWEKLSLDISFYNLRDHAATAPITPPSFSCQSSIQHRPIPNSNSNSINDNIPTIPQSLPPSSPSALESIPESRESFDTPLRSPSIGDWTFVHATPYTPVASAPPSEPETWILLGDDL